MATLATAHAYATRTSAAAVGLETVIEDATEFANDEDLQRQLNVLGKKNPAINSLNKSAVAAVERNGELLKNSGASPRI